MKKKYSVMLLLTLFLVSIPQAVVPESVQQLILQGREAQQRMEYDEAERIFRQVINEDPQNADAYIGLGIALVEQQHWREAVKAFEAAIDIKPDNATTYIYLGTALEGRNKRKRATEAYEKAIDIEPTNPQGHYHLGNVLRDRGRLEDAATAYEEAIKLDPQYAEPHVGLGFVRTQQGRLEESSELCDKAATKLSDPKTPVYAQARLCLGLAYQILGRTEDARDQFEAAERANPTWDRPLISIAEAQRDEIQSEDNPSTEAQSERFPDDDPWFQEKRSVVRIVASKPNGDFYYRGWVIQKKRDTAFILTCLHAVEGSSKIEVEFYSEPQEGELRLRRLASLPPLMTDSEENEEIDLVRLEVRDVPPNVKPLKLAKKQVRERDEISIVGTAPGTPPWIVIPGFFLSKDEDGALIVDALLGQESIGSPVLDSKERVIGIISEIEPANNMEVSTTRGVGYAIPIEAE